MHRGLARLFATASLTVLLPGIAPAQTPASPATPTPTEVERGAYLARAGDCVSCHSTPEGGAYGGGLRIDTPFGYLLSPNITFDPATGIGNWTRDDFWNALHYGVSKTGQYLFPVMPYTFTSKATRQDVDAIYAYLQTVPKQVYAVDVNHLSFPFSIRMTMLAWNELYFTPGTYVPDSAKSEAWNRGAYLVEGLGHCGACHEPRNLMGATEKSAGMTGAMIGDWFATNITPNRQTGLGTWSIPQIVTFLRNGQNAHMVAEGPMAEVVHNSLKYLTDADVTAIATFLSDQPAMTSPLSGPDPVAVNRATAAALYVNHCASCHGAQGAGFSYLGPPLRDNPMVVAPDPTDVVRATVGGLNAHFGRIPMPAELNGVTAGQLAQIINYVRTSWGNTAPPNATPAMVFAMQGKTAPQ
jgi:mono/diheme cytochrome c family protein